MIFILFENDRFTSYWNNSLAWDLTGSHFSWIYHLNIVVKKIFKNPRKTQKWVSSPNSDFCVCFFVFVCFLYMFSKKCLVGGWVFYGQSIYFFKLDKTSYRTLATSIHNHSSRYEMLKVIYRPLYGMNNYVLIWGDWLSCDPLRGSHDRKHLCPILWQLLFICHKFIHTI